MLTRRDVIKTLGSAAATLAISPVLHAQMAAPTMVPATPSLPPTPAPTGPFKLPPLGYAVDALEPYIDAQTMTIHHDKHHAAYVANLNAAVANQPALADKSVEELLTTLATLPEAVRTKIRNQGGGHANHTFFWTSLKKNPNGKPVGELATALDKELGGFDTFKKSFTTAATSVFGSGWAWLVLKDGKLAIESLPNQDTPLSTGQTPLLALDVWEHAYYLKYQNRRPEYIAAFFNVIDWDAINDRYKTAKS